MSDKTQSNKAARRKLLKSLVAGGGVLATGKLLPESWSRPVVESVILPAHAQTSGGIDGVYRTQALASSADGPAESILDMFASPAQAQTQIELIQCSNVTSIQFEIGGSSASVCVSLLNGDSVQGTTGVNRGTGELRDFTTTPFGFDMSNMQVDPAGTRIDGSLSCGKLMEDFTAFRTSIPYACINVLTSMYLSSPYRKA